MMPLAARKSRIFKKKEKLYPMQSHAPSNSLTSITMIRTAIAAKILSTLTMTHLNALNVLKD